jgi:O-antigen ligase
MDSVKAHWKEWGFPGDVLIHMHSTPLEIAFERGIPALVLWFWIMAVFWSTTSAAEKSFRYSSDHNLYGFFLGALGAISGFFASSMVNYNFGDGEVALVFWFLMGLVMALAPAEITEMPQNRRIPSGNSEAYK